MIEKYSGQTRKQTHYVALGICSGLVFGIAMDNIPIGLCLGIAIGTALERQNKETNP